jgi:hypothetical protein
MPVFDGLKAEQLAFGPLFSFAGIAKSVEIVAAPFAACVSIQAT